MLQHLSLSIVLPAYNEERNIEPLILEIDGFVKAITPDYEMIVVDDGSRDCTRSRLHRLQTLCPRLRVITHEKNLGYGRALRSGISQAQKDLILLMDADRQFKIEALPRFLEQVPYYAAVIGFRAVRRDNFYRRLLGRLGNAFLNLALKENFRDVNCGFKLIHARELKAIRLYSNGGLISCELIRKLLARDKTLCQLPVPHYPRERGKATGGQLRTAVRFLAEVPNLFRQ
jgi:glycosyltransferase involved in cell wall biosynthesis